MRKTNLLEDVQKSMTDPVYDICKNFSLEKSKTYYAQWADQWAAGNYLQNPAVKKEEVSFPFTDLHEAANQCCQANNMYLNLKQQDFNRWVDWYVYWQNIVVSWYRLKTFNEWLHNGLKDALVMHCNTPEDGVRKILYKELWDGMYSNGAIHMFAEGIITEDILKRLGQYEKYQSIKDRDIEKDIEEAKKALEDMEENNKGVTVLKLKI